MAEQTALRNNALPYPIYGVPFGVTFPILDADGDLVTGAAALDSERSLNGDTFADCTNEATEIATNSGMYYLLLTAAEMTADVVAIIVKTTTSGAKTTVLTLYPRKLVAVRSGTSQTGAAGSITLDASASPVDDYYNGMVCVATIDTLVEARVISDYVGSTKVASVSPNWNVTPDADDTFILYLPEGVQIAQADVQAWRNVAVPAANNAGYPMVDTIYIAGSNSNVSAMPGNVSTINSSVGATNATPSTGDPGSTSLQAQIKQLINVLMGTDGIATYPAAAAPGNAVSIAEALRAIYDFVAAATPALIQDAVWQEVLGAATAEAHMQFQTDSLAASPIARADAVVSASASTVVLDAGASGSDDAYNGMTIYISAGPGEGQAREIQDYVGSTQTATVDGDWTTQPTSASKYIIYR